MTAATTVRSAYPPAIADLMPRAIELTKTLDGDLPSRNRLMKDLHIGGGKANAVLTELAEIAKRDQRTSDIALYRAKQGRPFVAPPLTLVPDAPAEAAPPAPDVAADPVDAEPVIAAAPAIEHVPATAELAEPRTAATAADGRFARYGMAALLSVVGVLLAGVIVAPIALSSQDIIDWAASPVGLGLSGSWPLVTFLALDAAAAVCVGLVVYCAWRGESAGAFAWLVWAFAGMSAYANYSHSANSAAADAVWFFPAMSIAGPFLLEIIVRRVRRWVQEGTGQRARHSVSFGLARWVPGVGATRETYGAWRLARLDGITDARQAVTTYRQLCPDGSVRVLRALQQRDLKNSIK